MYVCTAHKYIRVIRSSSVSSSSQAAFKNYLSIYLSMASSLSCAFPVLPSSSDCYRSGTLTSSPFSLQGISPSMRLCFLGSNDTIVLILLHPFILIFARCSSMSTNPRWSRALRNLTFQGLNSEFSFASLSKIRYRFPIKNCWLLLYFYYILLTLWKEFEWIFWFQFVKRNGVCILLLDILLVFHLIPFVKGKLEAL